MTLSLSRRICPAPRWLYRCDDPRHVISVLPYEGLPRQVISDNRHSLDREFAETMGPRMAWQVLRDGDIVY